MKGEAGCGERGEEDEEVTGRMKVGLSRCRTAVALKDREVTPCQSEVRLPLCSLVASRLVPRVDLLMFPRSRRHLYHGSYFLHCPVILQSRTQALQSLVP